MFIARVPRLLPVCVDLNDNESEDNFLVQLGQTATTEENEDDD